MLLGSFQSEIHSFIYAARQKHYDVCKMLVVHIVTIHLDLPGQCLAILLMRLIQINWQ